MTRPVGAVSKQAQGLESAFPGKATDIATVSMTVASVSCCAGLWELLQGKRGDQIQPTPEDAKQETEMVLYDVVENLLQKTSTSPSEVKFSRHACMPYVLMLPACRNTGQ